MSTRLLRALALVVATAATLALAACTPGTPARTADAGVSPAAFPVSVTSALGTAEIPAAPKRIVTIGWGSADTAVALGTTPVGVEVDAWAGDADGYQAWTRAAIEEKGDALPQTFTVYPEVDVAAIVELAPDLILAPQSGLSQADFDVLNALAPTVAFPRTAWRTPWDEQISIIGMALGKSAEAARLVVGLRDTMAKTKAENPEFAGKSFAYISGGEPGTLGIYQAGDPRVDLISAIGLSEVPSIATMPVTPGTFSTSIGLERTDVLDDVDVLFTWFNDTASQATTEAQPLYARVPAVQRGSYIASVDRPLVLATSMITPYSVPWAIGVFVPEIKRAIAEVAQ